MMRKMAHIWKRRGASCMFGVVLMMAPLANADITVRNMRLDHALYPKHDPKLVVAGRVTAFKVPAGAETKDVSIRIGGIAGMEMTFHVDGVLFGEFKGDTLDLSVSSFEWPTVLVPREAGAYCILVLDQRADNTWLCTVVPAKAGKFERAKDYAALRAMLADQILAQLAAEKNLVRQLYLIEQAGPILEKERAKDVEPFLESKDVWVRRAALGAVTWATMDPKRIEEMDRDLAAFLGGDLHELVRGIEPGIARAPLPLLMEAYFPLECAWSPEEDSRKGPLLPLFRRIANDTRADAWTRWTYGISPMCQLGTSEDAAILWDWYTTKDAVLRKEVLDQLPYHRQALLMGLSRMFNLKLSNWVVEEFLSKEKEQAEIVRKALAEHSVIKE